MSHLKTNPVQALRRILRDHYHFPAIIKELLQNADDAKAHRFHIAWTSNWPISMHALLTSPALLVLNDGEFRKADAEAICHLDEGSKGDDLTTIGKYGLGMKSVFHLCEAFFFAGSPNQPAANGEPFLDILNPWPEGGPHDRWNQLHDARRSIFQRLASWKHGCDRWFCLVVPLRTTEQLAGSEPIVQGQLPLISEFRKEHDDLQIARYLPLLRSLTEVVVWDWDDQRFTLKSRVVVDGTHRQASSFPGLSRGERKPIRSKLLIENSEGPADAEAAMTVGIESLLDDDRFSEMKADPRWPKNLTINPVTRMSEDHSEKAEPHCAAVFSAYPAAIGRLDVEMAVFLPLSKRAFEPVPCGGNTAYQLLLHGHFFLDAGRRELYQTDDAKNGIQTEWNRLLLNHGALPLVIPALDSFRTTLGMPDLEVERLTAALRDSVLFQRHYQSICGQSSWVWCLRFDGNPQGGVWKSLPTEEGFLELPQPDGCEHNEYARLFPALPDLSQRVAITLENKPRLSPGHAQDWATAPQQLNSLLNSISSDSVCESKCLQLLASLLRRCRAELPTSSRSIVIEKIASAVASNGLGRLRGSREAVRAVLPILGPSAWVALGSIEKDAEPILQDLNHLSLGVLILPQDLPPAHVQGAKLSLAQAKKIMVWLENTAGSRPTARTAALAIRIAESTDGTQQQRIETLGAFRVFLIRDGGGREELVSWNTLCQLLTEQRLFAGRSEHLVALQKALRNTSVYSLFAPTDSQPFRDLLDLREPPSCNRQACVHFLLQSRPELGTLADRIELLDKLIVGLEGLPSREHLMAVRYLIHASINHYEDVDVPLLARSNLATGGVIGRVAELALKRLGSEWRWVSNTVYERLSPSQLKEFRITAVGPDALESILEEVGVEWLTAVPMEPDEAEVLLTEIRNSDLWRQLPLHETVGGERVAIAGRFAYIQSDIGQAVPTSLTRIITILKRPTHFGLVARYNELRVTSWDDAAAIQAALSQPEPHQFAIDVLDCFDRLASAGSTMPQGTLELLRTTPWVLCGERIAAPEHVVFLRDAEDELRRLTADTDVERRLICHLQVDPRVSEHPGFSKLRQRQVFPDRDASITLLAGGLKGLPRYCLGDLLEVTDEGSVTDLLCAFEGKADDLLPGLRLLGVLSRAYPDSLLVVVNRLLPAICGTLSIQVLQECLLLLSQRHETASRPDKPRCQTTFCSYLRQLLHVPGFNPDCLRPIRLLSRAGTWKSPERLCLSAEGIDRSELLDLDQAALFPDQHHAVIPGEAVSPEHSENVSEYGDAASLVKYFRAWEGLVPKPLIGAFLSLLGNQRELLDAAKEYLPPHSIEYVRGEIEWPLYQGTMTSGADEDIWTTMSKQRFLVRYGDSRSRVRVPNLVGGVFQASVGADVCSLFIGDLFFTHLKSPQPPYRFKPLTLRTFDVEPLSLEQRKSVLLESASCLLDKIYNRRPGNLLALWRVLSDTGQFELEIVQEQLLRSSWFYFQQLGHGRLSQLRALTRKHDELTDRQVELRHRVSKTQTGEPEKIESELRELSRQLRALLENDEHVQHNTLQAVRQKMEDYEYSVGSIPFELFQNSDDAAAELAEMTADQQPRIAGLDTVAVELEPGVFRFMHWGRPVNEFRRAAFTSDRGRERGYHNDLKKMLVLTASDKTERSQVVTGKFGLGFKTVFFLSDRPLVLSGDLGFEVIGGFYPRRLSEPVLCRLQETLARALPVRRDGTVIELPLLDSSGADLAKAFGKFHRLLPLMLAFSRQIRCCELAGMPGGRVRLCWREKPLPGVPDAAVGTVEASENVRNALASRALLIRNSGRGAIFLSLGAFGFEALPDDVPTFWVTAPTTEHRGVGFSINAVFSLDVGRKQLAESDENVQAGRGLGHAAGEAFVKLFDQTGQWDTFTVALGISKDTTAKDFWTSLWGLLASPQVNQDPILKEAIWAHGAGMARLATERPAIPAGLSGEYDTLTQCGQITHGIVGLLDENPGLFAAVCAWPGFGSMCRPGRTVSDKRVFGFLRTAMGSEAPRPKTVSLADALRIALGDDLEVSASLAAELGRVLNREAFKKWSETENGRRECEACSELLRAVVFRNQGGMLSAPRVLLVPSRGGDERLRAAFAPPKHLLDESYTGTALDFFLLCRTELHTPATTLAEWAIDACSDTVRKAALEYLHRGESRAGMAEYLRQHKAGTWLEDPPTQLLAGREECDQVLILGALGASFNQVSQFSGTAGIPFTPIRSPSEVLTAIAEWWRTHRKEHLAACDRRLYGDGGFPELPRDLSVPQSRTGWLRLFLLGILQTLGWTSDDRNRQFLEDCERRGWMDALSAVNSEPDRWIRMLDDFIEQQVEEIAYFQSMKQLLGLFVIARRLDEYVDAFLAIDHLTDEFPLTAITKPRTSAFFQGGGPDAPPVSEVLGIGQCFVMRELARHGVIRNQRAHSYCYVPVKRVRRLIQCLDPNLNLEEDHVNRWERSRAIHRWLHGYLAGGASFEGDFDIPLRIIADSRELWQKLLGQAYPDESFNGEF